MSDKTDELNLPEEIRALSAQLSKKLTINENHEIGGTKEDVDALKAVYEATLPEGLTLELAKKLQTHHKNLTVAMADALGNVGREHLKKHKKVEEVRLEKFPMVGDFLKGSYKREATVTGIGGAVSTKHGLVAMKYVTASAGTTGALFGRVKNHHAALGAELFGK